MNKTLLALLLVFSCTFSLTTTAQNIDSTLNRYATEYQPEKIYLHYDKASYAPGETIWFKAYLMQAFLPANESKTIYIDWVGESGEVLWHTVAPIVAAISNGQFALPADYNGRLIHVRAYTKWMLNFDTAFLYKKEIPVLQTKTGKPVSKPAIVTTLQFFPESGDIVADVANNVAFKATDQWGSPVKVNGVVLDNNGKVVDSLRTVHDGMGSFQFVPKTGVTYSARWKDEKGAVHTSNLPAAKAAGVSMQVSLDGTKRIILLHWSNDVVTNTQQVHLVGTMAQRPVFKTTVAANAEHAARRLIPTENLPSGILTITLFDHNWNAVAERITFINNNEYSFQPKLEVQHWGLSKRGRNEILLTVPDGLESTSLSVSVSDASIGRDSANTIISDLLLTSEIKGLVYNPAYYFSDSTDATAKKLDLVMLTNGWRRFKWEDVVAGKLPQINYPKDTAYLSLSGQVYGVPKSQLSGNEAIFLFVKEGDTTTVPLLLPLEKNGTFRDPEFVFFDTLRVYYQLKSKLFSNAEAKFMTDRIPAPNYKNYSKNFPAANPYSDTTGDYYNAMLAAEAQKLLAADRGNIMENITVTARAKSTVEELNEKYTSGLFQSGDSYNFDMINDPSATAQRNIFTYLQSRVAGLQINTAGATPQLTWRGAAPSLFLDEMPVEADFLSGLPVGDIAFVKVFRPPFIGAFGGGSGGAIAIYTRKGDDLRSKPGGLTTNSIAGYTPIKEFYSPNYSTFNKQNELRDVRSTLYWNPGVNTTTANNAVKLTFYNNDVTQAFRVVVEGMSKEGLLTHYEQILE